MSPQAPPVVLAQGLQSSAPSLMYLAFAHPASILNHPLKNGYRAEITQKIGGNNAFNIGSVVVSPCLPWRLKVSFAKTAIYLQLES